MGIFTLAVVATAAIYFAFRIKCDGNDDEGENSYPRPPPPPPPRSSTTYTSSSSNYGSRTYASPPPPSNNYRPQTQTYTSYGSTSNTSDAAQRVRTQAPTYAPYPNLDYDPYAALRTHAQTAKAAERHEHLSSLTTTTTTKEHGTAASHLRPNSISAPASGSPYDYDPYARLRTHAQTARAADRHVHEHLSSLTTTTTTKEHGTASSNLRPNSIPAPASSSPYVTLPLRSAPKNLKRIKKAAAKKRRNTDRERERAAQAEVTFRGAYVLEGHLNDTH
ncbi:hypothetical protein EW146_g3453 [Bondarzewia mesenterica]|uniref:BZIP domain-containing protein n=1 Tax=Bondarzewia mesenterica TaxID=1095465 RepID=A0A4S4LXZ4_9AGAM|nr:hypothetical protein EW146_g3453 [Bondarzewia mesenterica]